MDACPRLQCPNDGIVPIPVVVLLLAIGSLAASAVKPDCADVAVIRQQLRQLGNEVVVICLAGAVEGLVSVPGGEIHAEFQPILAAGCGNLRHHVALAVFPGTGGNAVACVAAGPEAEAVVVLAGEDQALHPCIPDSRSPLVRVQLHGVENGGGFGAVAPFLVGEGVDGEMHKGVELHLLQRQLPGGGNDLYQTFIKGVHGDSSFCYSSVKDLSMALPEPQ